MLPNHAHDVHLSVACWQDQCRHGLEYACKINERSQWWKSDSVSFPDQPQSDANQQDDQMIWDEGEEDEIPRAVIYVIAGLLILSFALYLIVGGGHNHFH